MGKRPYATVGWQDLTRHRLCCLMHDSRAGWTPPKKRLRLPLNQRRACEQRCGITSKRHSCIGNMNPTNVAPFSAPGKAAAAASRLYEQRWALLCAQHNRHLQTADCHADGLPVLRARHMDLLHRQCEEKAGKLSRMISAPGDRLARPGPFTLRNAPTGSVGCLLCDDRQWPGSSHSSRVLKLANALRKRRLCDDRSKQTYGVLHSSLYAGLSTEFSRPTVGLARDKPPSPWWPQTLSQVERKCNSACVAVKCSTAADAAGAAHNEAL